MDPADASRSFWDWFREKTTSPLYLTYISAFIIWNWKFFAVLFFEDPKILGIPKIEYIQTNVLNHQYLNFLPLPISWDIFTANRLYELVPPVILTWVILYLLPPVANRVHRHSLKYFFERQLEYHTQSNEYKEKILGSKKEEARLTQEISETEKEIQREQENLSEEQKWQFEYDLLQRQNFHISLLLASVERVIYGGGHGYFHTTGTGEGQFISSSDLATLDSMELINIDSDREKMELTKKGKFFLRICKSQKV